MTPEFTAPSGRPRTFTSAREAAVYVVSLSRHLPALVGTYRRTTLDRQLRERVMVAVSHTNACAGCAAIHARWALHAGVTTAELEAIGAGELAALDQRSRAAIAYATALAEAGFRDLRDDELISLVRLHLTDGELKAVEAVARAIAFANLTVNSLRRSRQPDLSLA